MRLRGAGEDMRRVPRRTRERAFPGRVLRGLSAPRARRSVSPRVPGMGRRPHPPAQLAEGRLPDLGRRTDAGRVGRTGPDHALVRGEGLGGVGAEGGVIQRGDGLSASMTSLAHQAMTLNTLAIAKQISAPNARAKARAAATVQRSPNRRHPSKQASTKVITPPSIERFNR